MTIKIKSGQLNKFLDMAANASSPVYLKRDRMFINASSNTDRIFVREEQRFEVFIKDIDAETINKLREYEITY